MAPSGSSTRRARASPGRDRAGSTAPALVVDLSPDPTPFPPSPPSPPRGTTPIQPSHRAPTRTAPKGSHRGRLAGGGRRLDEHHMLRRDADVVLPGRSFQLHRLGGPQTRRPRPIRRCAGRCPRRHRSHHRHSFRRRHRTGPARRQRPPGARATRWGRSAHRRTPPAPRTASTATGSQLPAGPGPIPRARRRWHRPRTPRGRRKRPCRP